MHFVKKKPNEKRLDFVNKLKKNKILRVPGAYNPLTAKLIEEIGYDAVYVSGGVIAALVGLVIIGGIKRIAAVASRLVPTMAVLYVLGTMVIIITHSENIMPSFAKIFTEAFSLKAGWGGLFAVIMWGVRRGLYSNEAGQGSSPIAHASAKAEKSVEQGMVSILEPFIDTIIVCSVTAMVILSSGAWVEKYENSILQPKQKTFFANFL